VRASEQIVESLNAYWASFLNHVPNIILALIILVLSILISGWLSRIFKNRLGQRLDDPLLSSFLAKILRTTLIVLGLLLAFNAMGLTGIAGGLLAGAGVGAIVIGFAFQDIGSNFLGGIILAFNRPFNIGDTVEIGEHMGKVVALSLRTTQIKTFDGKDVYIPNSTMIQDELINFTIDGFLRMEFMVGVDYDEDVDRVQDIIAKAIIKVEGVLTNESKKPLILISELGTSTVNLSVKFWVETYDYKVASVILKSRVIKQVLNDLVAANVGLPADILELKHYKGKGFPVRMLNNSTAK
jgi:small conductance mechanosensitive channel